MVQVSPVILLRYVMLTNFRSPRVFRDSVSKADVPDYFDVIKKPMCWKLIDEKVDRNMYARLKDLRYTFFLILVIISVILSRISTSIRKISIFFLIMLWCITRSTLQLSGGFKNQSPSDSSYSVFLAALDQASILRKFFINLGTYSENSDICLGGFTFDADSFCEDFLEWCSAPWPE